MTDALSQFVETSTARRLPPEIAALAGCVGAAHRKIVAILIYGSALRDAALTDTVVDFYVLTESAAGVSANPVSRAACRIIPPNVYFAEHMIGGKKLRSKYAAMTIADFASLVQLETRNPYLWARFAQPCGIVFARDDSARAEVCVALAQALRTGFAHARFLAPSARARLQWQALFENTYRTELRPEPPERAALIIATDRDYYETAARLMPDVAPIVSSWRAKRGLGKLWSVARLAKAAFTFRGGVDYAAWKIERHSGIRIEVTDWHRRHPVFAGLMFLPKLWRRGAVR